MYIISVNVRIHSAYLSHSSESWRLGIVALRWQTNASHKNAKLWLIDFRWTDEIKNISVETEWMPKNKQNKWFRAIFHVKCNNLYNSFIFYNGIHLFERLKDACGYFYCDMGKCVWFIDEENVFLGVRQFAAYFSQTKKEIFVTFDTYVSFAISRKLKKSTLKALTCCTMQQTLDIERHMLYNLFVFFSFCYFHFTWQRVSFYVARISFVC